jgi:CRP-like cAMP-binding protein
MMAKKKKQKVKRTASRVDAVRQSGGGRTVANEALLAMAEEEWRVLGPRLRHQEMPNHLVLHEPNEPVKFLYFPNSGLISLVILMHDQRTVEAGIVGREGIVGLPAAMGFPRHPLQEIVQVSGDAFRIPVQALRKLAPRLPELFKYATRYIMSLGLQVAQTAACNRVHDLEQRLARWLLMAQDRLRADSVAITQDFLATMVGTDRPSVSLAEGLLAGAGAIERARGVVRIIDRGRLEGCACECYGVIARYAAGVASGRIPAPIARARTNGSAVGSQAAASFVAAAPVGSSE